MQDIAPHIFRKRLLIEGFYERDINEQTIRDYFRFITTELSLRTYGESIVHATSGEGKDVNQGYDAFVPLIDSGIYLGVWSNERFLSLIIYTCKDFDETSAVEKTQAFFRIREIMSKLF